MPKFYGRNDPLPAAPRGRGRGFDMASKPKQTSLQPYTGKRYPRSDWRELMDIQEKQQSSPWHQWKAAGVAVKDQKSSSWCWCFGTVGAIQNRYAQQGMGDTRLSAASVAGQRQRAAGDPPERDRCGVHHRRLHRRPRDPCGALVRHSRGAA